jgi:AsmA protein
MSGNPGKKYGVLKAVAVVAVLLVAAIVALPFVLDVNQFRPEIESKIADDPAFSRSPFVTAKSLRVGIELVPLIFSKEARITGITLDHPAITLIRSSSGMWNFSDLGNKPDVRGPASSDHSGGLPGTDVSIKHLRIQNGRVTILRGRKQPSVYENVDINASDLSFASSFPFTLTASLPGSGNLNLEGKAGPLNTTDIVRTPMKAALAVTHFDLLASGFASSDSGLGGLLDFSGTATSDGGQAQSKGYANIDKLQLVRGGSPAGKPVWMEYVANYDLVRQGGTLGDSKVQVGEAVAHLNGTYQMRGDHLVLKMRLRGTNMPVQDLVTLLPAFGVALPKGASLQGGTLNTDLSAEGPFEKMVIAGTADIAKTRLVGFDLSGNLATLAKLAGLPSNADTEIEKFSSRIQWTPEGIQVSDLLLVVPALGELSGAGKIAADQSLDFAMQARLEPSGGIGNEMTRLISGGALKVPFFVRGTASEPKFIPDINNAVGGLLESGLSGKGSKEGQKTPGGALGDVLRDLLKKK